MKKMFVLTFALAAVGFAQIGVPEGTKIRLRLEQNLSSGTVDTGSTVEFAVTQAVEIGGVTVISEGARATGTVTEAVGKRFVGRSGKLDFSIDRCMSVDGRWIALRYSVNKNHGKGRGVTTGIVAAGLAAVVWPAAPLAFLIKGKDVVLHKGTIFEVFSDENVVVANSLPGGLKPGARGIAPIRPQEAMMMAAALNNRADGYPLVNPANYLAPAAPAVAPPEPPALESLVSVAINSSKPDADIEVDGAFVGSTPSTMKLAPGTYQIKVTSGSQVWQRSLRVTPGSNISLNAAFPAGAAR